MIKSCSTLKTLVGLFTCVYALINLKLFINSILIYQCNRAKKVFFCVYNSVSNNNNNDNGQTNEVKKSSKEKYFEIFDKPFSKKCM